MPVEKNEELRKCGFCKKTVKMAKRFYRNGRYYCNMNCWNKTKSKDSEEGSADAKA